MRRFSAAQLLYFVLISAGFALLYVLAYHFRLERTQYETAAELFHVINSNWFYVHEKERFIVCFSQILPLLAVHCKLSLNQVVTAYSINHVFFFHIVSLLCLFYGSKTNSLLTLFIPVLGGESSFFIWPYAELLYGCAMLLLWDSIYLSFSKGLRKNLALIVLPFFIVTSHPLVFLLFLGLLIWRRPMTAFGSNVKLTLFAMISSFTLLYTLDSRPYRVLYSPEGFYQHFGPIKQQLIDSFTWLLPDTNECLLTFLSLFFVFQMYKRLMPVVYFLLFVLTLYLVAFLGVPGIGKAPFYKVIISLCLLFVLLHTHKPKNHQGALLSFSFLFWGMLTYNAVAASAPVKERTKTITAFVNRVISLEHHTFLLKNSPAFYQKRPELDYFLQPESVLFSSIQGQTVSVVSQRYFKRSFIADIESCTDPKMCANQVTRVLIDECPRSTPLNYTCHSKLNTDYFNVYEEQYQVLSFSGTKP